MSLNPRCSNCRFGVSYHYPRYVLHNSTLIPITDSGVECRRYPPTTTTRITEPNYWCGEWQPTITQPENPYVPTQASKD